MSEDAQGKVLIAIALLWMVGLGIPTLLLLFESLSAKFSFLLYGIVFVAPATVAIIEGNSRRRSRRTGQPRGIIRKSISTVAIVVGTLLGLGFAFMALIWFSLSFYGS